LRRFEEEGDGSWATGDEFPSETGDKRREAPSFAEVRSSASSLTDGDWMGSVAGGFWTNGMMTLRALSADSKIR